MAADRARLAWQVSLVPSVSPIGDWEVLVDAATGEIFRVLDHSCHANGSGFTFDPDPLATAQATYGQTGYTDGNDAATTQLNAARTSVTLNDITDLGGGVWKLQGPYAQVVDSESPFKGLFTQASTTFNFDRAADNFEAVNCYYHIDHVMRHINQNLGITLMPLEYAGGVRYDPSGFNGADNSHYIPSTGNLAFGGPCNPGNPCAKPPPPGGRGEERRKRDGARDRCGSTSPGEPEIAIAETAVSAVPRRLVLVMTFPQSC